MEEDYRQNPDTPVIKTPYDLTQAELWAYQTAIDMGNAFEILSSLEDFKSEENEVILNMSAQETAILFAKARLTFQGERIDELVDVLLELPKSEYRVHGLTESGVYRDQTANRLGAEFGLMLFRDPDSVPTIRYDNYPFYHGESLEQWIQGVRVPERYDEWDPTPRPSQRPGP